MKKRKKNEKYVLHENTSTLIEAIMRFKVLYVNCPFNCGHLRCTKLKAAHQPE